tara:strand:- start:3124 stop:3312 length:189 start_codon:yes stop_codon:yes gene_type:complete
MNELVPAGLSLVAPGLGHMVMGHWGWMLFWFIITPGFWIGTGGLAGWLCHILCAYQTWHSKK